MKNWNRRTAGQRKYGPPDAGVEATRPRKNEMGLRGFQEALYAAGAMNQHTHRVDNSRALLPAYRAVRLGVNYRWTQ